MTNDNHNVFVEVEAGASVENLTQFAQENGLSGLEFTAGLTGTIGAAAINNADVYTSAMADIVDYILVVNPENGELTKISNKEIGYSNEFSSFQGSRGVVYAVGLKLKRGDRDNIAEDMKIYQDEKPSDNLFPIWKKREYVREREKSDPNATQYYIYDAIPVICNDLTSRNGKVIMPSNRLLLHSLIIQPDATLYDIADLAKQQYDEAWNMHKMRLVLKGHFLGITNKENGHNRRD